MNDFAKNTVILEEKNIANNKIGRRWIRNPFIWFALIWTIVPLIHLLNITSIYPSLNIKMGLFLLTIVGMSWLFAVLFDRFFLKGKDLVMLENDKPSYKLLIFGCLLTLMEFVYSKQIPLFVIRSDAHAYSAFGIPTISFAITSYFYALLAVASAKFVYGAKKNQRGNFIIRCRVVLRFLLTYSRGGIITCFLIFFFLWLSKHKFSFRLFLLFICVGLAGLVGFNILGNIRMNSAWNDSSAIIELAHIRPNYSFLSGISWSLVYLDTPLGNLLYNIEKVSYSFSGEGLLSQLLPDYLSKRIWPMYDSSLELVVPALTVSSMFAGGFKYGGFFGRFLCFAELSLFIFAFGYLTRNNFKYFLATSSSLCVVALLTFFDNTISYSGSSFYLVFIAFASVFDKSLLSPKQIQMIPSVFLETITDINL